ncbi:hypothetical protein [Natronorubrum thiooxidans]|uniref:DUF8076 domain-containing protein n=1 Tax=Natronorubrum thiooxidans TaxID=308853 RepID=A0A1N7H2D8_9EURY|nr:hypothetical protein [Natronorubrum thiooxidans]SIS18973.1 hypothetical protein SAMN05421752_12136 [Natronorubrum thiooxidans]
MNFDIGYHVVSRDVVGEGDTFDAEMSIVEFLRRVNFMGDIPFDVTVYGLDDYLRGADDADEICDHLHRLLSERVNYLLNQNPRVQFVVDDVEFWDEPVIPDDDVDIRLNKIFHGALDQEGAGWYSSHLNVTS